ncbi:MAG: fructose-bisphosphate aldolase [Actinomycetota bacterium]|nr:fructose-bisphosphate aldolase [Actinomycetota bacterium]
MNESNPARDKRFARAGIAPTAEARRVLRALIVTTADDSSRFPASGNGRIVRSSFASGSGPGVGPGPPSFTPLMILSPRHLSVRCSPSGSLPARAKGGAGLGSGPLLPVRRLDVAAC